MPMSPVDATLWIRSAALINKSALQSVAVQLAGQLLEVDTWAASPAKGRMREALQRMRSLYVALCEREGEAVRLANVILDMFNAGGNPNPPQPPIVWSTGAW